MTYQDANALYAWAISQLLSTKRFAWVAPDQVDILNVPKNSNIGYILEVDLEYPEELHNKHNDYPLALEHLNITDDMMSPFQRGNFPAIRGSVRMVVPNLKNRKIYASLSKSPIIYNSVVELDKKEGLPGKNCYQAKFSTVGIAKLSSLRLKKSPH